MDQDKPSKPAIFRSEQATLPEHRKVQSGRAWRWLGALAIAGFACAAIVVSVHRSQTPLPLPPSIDSDDMHAAVAERLVKLRQAVIAKPRDGSAWGRLGMMFVAHEMTAEAEQCFTQACRFDRGDFRWHYLLGAVLEPIDKEAAIDAYQQAAQLDQSVPQPRLNIAELLLDLHRLDDAEQALMRTLATEPVNARAEFLLARLYLLRGDHAEALRRAARSFHLSPEQRATRELLAQLHLRCGNAAKAEQVLRDLESLPTGITSWEDPTIKEALSYRVDPFDIAAAAQAQSLDGNSSAAIRSLEMLINQFPNEPAFHVRLIDALLDDGQTDAAAAAAGRAKSQCQDNSEVTFASGMVFLRGEDYTAAAADFRKAAKLSPEHFMAYFRLGECLRELGETENAIAAFRDATRISPSFLAGEREAARLTESIPALP